jgi:hypothetical protein
VDDIPCDRLSQEKDFVQRLIEQQVSSFDVMETLLVLGSHQFLFFNREKRKLMLKE